MRQDEAMLMALEEDIDAALGAEQNGTAVGVKDALFDFVHGMAHASSPCQSPEDDKAVDAYAELLTNAQYLANNMASRKCLGSCLPNQMTFASTIHRLKKCQVLPVPEPASAGAKRSLAQTVWDEDSPLNLGKKLEEIYSVWQTIIEAKAADNLKKTHCDFDVSKLARSMVELQKNGVASVLAKWRAKPQAEIDALKAEPTRVPGSAGWHTCFGWHFKSCGDFCCCKAGKHYVAAEKSCNRFENDDQARLHFALWDQVDTMADAAYGTECQWSSFSFRTQYLIAKARAGLSAAVFVTYQKGGSWADMEVQVAEKEEAKETGAGSLAQISTDSGDPLMGGAMIGGGLMMGGATGGAMIVIGVMMMTFG